MTIVDENTFVLGLWDQPGVLYETDQRFHVNASAIKTEHSDTSTDDLFSVKYVPLL